MRNFSLKFLLLALAAAMAVAQSQSSDQNGSLTGTVRDSVTHQPVKRASVALNPLSVGFGRRGDGNASTTDVTGTFSFTSVSAGQYQIVVTHPGYPQGRTGSVSKKIEIKAGEKAGPVELELIPGASVTGHVADEDGDPLSGCMVQAHSAKTPPQIRASGSTNAEGEFRVFGLEPGKYTLSAQCQMPVFQPRPLSSGPDPPASVAYPLQYYPLTTEAKSAEAVEVVPGMEKAGIEFRMHPAAITQVRGSFSGIDVHDRQDLMLQLVPANFSEQQGMMGATGRRMDPAKGTFEFPRVFPGSYFLAAFTNGEPERRIGAFQRIEVKDRPLDVVVELRRGMDINGTVEIDPSGGNPNSLPTLSQVNVQLPPQFQVGMPYVPASVDASGNISLKGILPGPYRLQVNVPNGYLKSAWLGTTELKDNMVDLSAGVAGDLRLRIGTNVGTISGSVPAGVVVFAVPIEEHNIPGNSRGAPVDQNGQFKIMGLAPGRYRVVLAEAAGPIPDDGGQEVTLHEGESLTVEPKPTRVP